MEQDIEKNSIMALGLLNVHILREYGIATYHMKSCVKSCYLEFNSQNEWAEKGDSRNGNIKVVSECRETVHFSIVPACNIFAIIIITGDVGEFDRILYRCEQFYPVLPATSRHV